MRSSIRAALTEIVLSRLPALRVGIEGEDTKKPVFVALPSLDLRDHLEFVVRPPGLSADEYDGLLIEDLRRENARPWLDLETHSPWRLVVFLNLSENWADVAFEVHHALADGKSGLVFHNHLVEVLNAGGSAAGAEKNAENSDILSFTELPQLVPTQEELIKFTLSWSFFLGTLWKELGPGWFNGTPPVETYTGHKVALEHSLKGNLRLFHLSPENAQALLDGCRAHGITLTALVQGLMMVLFARRFSGDIAPSFSCVMPISLRPFVPSGATELDINRNMANLVSGHSYSFEKNVAEEGRAVAENDAEDDEKVWRAAAAVSANLKAALSNITEDNVLGLLAWVSDWHDWWRKHEGKTRDSTWTVSNTGSILPGGEESSSSAEGTWRRTRNFYSQSAMGKDSLISVNIGGVRGGELSFVTAWAYGVVEDDFANLLTDDLRACLEHYGKTGHFSVPNRL